MKNRLLAIILVLSMILGLIPAVADESDDDVHVDLSFMEITDEQLAQYVAQGVEIPPDVNSLILWNN